MVILLLIIMNLILFGLPKGKMMITTVLLLYIKLTKQYTSSFSGQQDVETYYVAIYVDDVDSAYLDEKSHYWYGASLYGSDGKELSDLNALETALKEKFDDQNFRINQIKKLKPLF